MKKLLFLMVVGFGGAMLVKNGHLALTRDNHVRFAGYTVPLPAAVQNSPVMGLVSTLMVAQLQSQTTAAASRPGAGGPPPMPTITSATSTYTLSAPTPAQAKGTDQFNAVAKALRGSQ